MIIHGFARRGGKHSLYTIWRNMKERCLNPNKLKYERYGGRGIKIQENWINDPSNFIDYIRSLPDYEYRKSMRLSLDRIENDGDYVEGNLRWATPAQQAINRRQHT